MRWPASCEVKQAACPGHSGADREMNFSRLLDADCGPFATQGENHEACSCPSIDGSRLHRLEHYGSKRRRLRSRCVPGRLRQCRRCRGRRTSCCPPCCPCCCCRATRGRCTPQSVLSIG